ncbi:MAG: methyltransferase domain-containing protein [Mailhella sp.]|nr:methyltransferase domain-containing protein [Mailhella sp.]
MDIRPGTIASAQRVLLERAMSGWKAQGASLLVVGSSWELDPDWLWRRGFDVTIIDRAPDFSGMVRAASPKVACRLGAPDALPFENGSFDYAVLNHQLYASRDAVGRQDILQEALRVASRSILVLEWNRLLSGRLRSAGAGKGVLPCPSGSALPCAYPWEMASLFRQCCPERKTSWLSTWLPGEGLLPGKLLRPVQSACLSLPLGALIGVRLDWRSATGSALSLLDRAKQSLRISAGGREEVLGNGVQGTLRGGSPAGSPSRERRQGSCGT